MDYFAFCKNSDMQPNIILIILLHDESMTCSVMCPITSFVNAREYLPM